MKLVESVVQSQAEIAAIRRDIHSHPETGYKEHRTSDLVAQRLEQWGAQVHRGLGGTGVVGIIRGQSDNGRAVGLRADLDALPMQEHNQFEHASRHDGVMHACGHDGHTAMLLAAARHLAQHRDFAGTVYTIFQPAEEGLVGAGKMIEDGLFTRFPMEAVFGMHNQPGLPVGTFGVLNGPVMASSSYFQITITGRGGHAAKPHLTHDPVMTVVHLAQMIQTIRTRSLDPIEPAALSITQIHAGSADNVIPDTATLHGTLRVFSEDLLATFKQRLDEVIRSVCEGMGCTADLRFRTNYPPTINHPVETDFAAKVLSGIVGPDQVLRTLKPSLGGEDFALMLKQRPGCYVWIGNGDGGHREHGHGDGPCALHNPSYDFNDALIPIGGSYWVELARQWLARS